MNQFTSISLAEPHFGIHETLPGTAWTRDGRPFSIAAADAADVAILAHADDIVMGLAHRCVRGGGHNLLDVVATNGAGNFLPEGVHSAAQLSALREAEEIAIAERSRFPAVALLRFSSAEMRDSSNPNPTRAIAALIAGGRRAIFTHNPFDSHPTHLAVLLRVVAATASLGVEDQPHEMWGVEVWGGLDFIEESRLKYEPIPDVNEVAELVALYRTQNLAQGYDRGLPGRLRANATFRDPHSVRRADGLVRLVDLADLIGGTVASVGRFVDQAFGEACDRRRSRVTELVRAASGRAA